MSVITDLIDENSSCNARIAELEARIVELESAAESLRISRDYHHEQENEYRRRWAGVTTGAHSIVIPERDAVIRKAVGMCNRIPGSTTWNAAEYAYDELVAILYAAPVSEVKAQGEYGEAYQGAREDLAIWKRRALEAEEKVLQQEQIIDHLTSEAQGESRFGEPVVTPDAPCVPDGYVLADKKALGTVLQALVNAPHHIRELQVTRQPVELFSDNPINVLIANYEAPAAPVEKGWPASPLYAAPVSEAKAQEPDCDRSACGDFSPGPCDNPDCSARRDRTVVAPAAKAQGVVQWPEADEIMQMAFEEGQPADDASGYCFELEEFDLFIERLMSEVARLNAAPAAPAADAGLVEALELAANRLDRLALEQGEFWRGYATAWADEARATANGVKS